MFQMSTLASGSLFELTPEFVCLFVVMIDLDFTLTCFLAVDSLPRKKGHSEVKVGWSAI